MPESDARDPEPEAPATPRVSGEVASSLGLDETPLPESRTQSAPQSDEAPALSDPGDTLLSAGKPAERWELVLDDRVGALDRKLEELEDRLSALERKRPREAAPEARHKPWLWIAFLLAIAVVFQLLRRVR